MGACTSSQISRHCCIEKEGAVDEGNMATGVPPSSTKVIHMDGRLDEYEKPVKAWQAIAGSPWCQVCSSEVMMVGQHVPGVPEEEALQPGQLYFLLPLSAARQPLSLADLCHFAIIASAVRHHRRLPQPWRCHHVHVLRQLSVLVKGKCDDSR